MVEYEEWRIKGKLLQELNALRSRIAQLEQSEHRVVGEECEDPKGTFRLFFNDVIEGVLLTDPENGRFLAGNRAICEMLGCNSEDIANLEVTAIFSQEDLEDVREKLTMQKNGERTIIKNALVKKKVGSYFSADIISVPLSISGKTHAMNIVRETPLLTTKLEVQSDTSHDSNTHQNLTATEIRVMRLSVRGKSCKEIAQLLHRSTRTIENHRSHLLKKLGVDNSIQLVRKLAKMGIVELS
jgi:PAS domain S-box-containing protein